MTTLFKPGTPDKGLPQYTLEQLAVLDGKDADEKAGTDPVESIKQVGLQMGAARAEFVNHVLFSDGTIGDNHQVVLTALNTLRAAALSGDVTDNKVLEVALACGRKIEEVLAHAAENRFLFVVDANGVPSVYFQCAVDGNPDVY